MEPEKLPFGDYANFWQAIIDLAARYKGHGFVYKLFTEENGTRVPIPRVAGRDQNGILYIGQTIAPTDRLPYLFRSFKEEPTEGKLWRHGADEIYWQCKKMQEKYPVEKMVVEIIPCLDPRAREIEEISAYYVEFGEVPPLNSAIAKRK